MSISVWDFFSGAVGQLVLAGMVVNTAEQSRPKSSFQFQEKWNLIEFSMPNVSERNILTSQLVCRNSDFIVRPLLSYLFTVIFFFLEDRNHWYNPRPPRARRPARAKKAKRAWNKASNIFVFIFPVSWHFRAAVRNNLRLYMLAQMFIRCFAMEFA